jgi:hypothetical protein
VAETIQNLYMGFAIALSPGVLVYAFLGCLVGTLVGVLPGVGPLAGISLLLPLTFGLDATRALVMLAGIYYGAMYGGSTTSILMRIPGEAASVMTCIDGYAMARKGRAGPALAICAVGSYVAGTVSVVALMLLAPPLAEFALRFGPPEYFALLLLGLLVLAYMSPGSMLNGLAMAALGLLLGMVGIDQMSGFLRYAYGVPELADGLGVVAVTVQQSTYANGTHAVVLEVDPETGALRILRWVVAHDCGHVLHPGLVDGQVHGGVVQGIPDALNVQLAYDAAGQRLTGTLMEYALATASDAPPVFEIRHLESPTPLNPLGAKGAGEGGIMPVHPVLAQAVEDALAPFGVVVTRVPFTRAELCDMVRRARFEGPQAL